ncbi:alkaline phosphatase family protein [Antarcticimicrobium sediminis]|uniref:Phosphonoacetate hydrolase n=1 Tax=Antarcticimicrobium sediminis TaxID=2546227 RepID=A0A4R5EEK0_9RHOB|nr:alkaline phosphatase family protein [Antarcticimicrobium sediminis]TDE32720.1 phosphonoacetate hydrolase [Antarcticimicrobium sediminis]
MDRIEVNGRSYDRPEEPTVVVCFDGCDPRYLDAAKKDNVAPFMTEELLGFCATSAMPSFTNPNNVSIVTGARASIHGISGNYFCDIENDREVMMNSPEFLRCGTILAAQAAEGVSVAVITAKEKLMKLLGHGLPSSAVCRAIETGGSETWLPATSPNMYGPDSTLAVFDSGIRLLKERSPELIYLSTTDYMQHTYAPEAPEALAFYASIDERLRMLHGMGARLVVTADHGMNCKSRGNGELAAVWLKGLLEREGVVGHIVLPISDPHVKHHGALGGLGHIYLADDKADQIACVLRGIEGIERVMGKAEAANELALPFDRIGDLVVIADANHVVGTRPTEHDLAALDGALRSHGGFAETRVPFLVNRSVSKEHEISGLWNFDV